MKRLILLLIFITLILFGLSYFFNYYEDLKEPKYYLKASKNLILKGENLKIDLTEAKNYYNRARKQYIMQKGKIFLLKNYNYSKFLFQKSIDFALKEIKKYKELERKEKENFLNKLDQIKALNSKLYEAFCKMPLGSEFFILFLKSSVHLREAEKLYNINHLESAKKKMEIAYFETENLYNKIKNSLKDFYSLEKILHWKKLYNEAIEISKKENVIVVIKDERVLKVLKNGKTLKSYEVEFGKNPLSKKIKSGDLATPEGRYKIVEKKGPGKTKYFLALLLNYPNEEDKKRFEEAKRKGLIPKNAKIGGLIEIHGEGGIGIDWTEGCVALSNEDMKELFSISSVGTPVYIIGSLGNNNILSEFEKELWKNSKNS